LNADQFIKYYNDYVVKIRRNALESKSGGIMQVDWTGNKATVVDTDTGEAILAYVL
jgi:hypothetical protein